MIHLRKKSQTLQLTPAKHMHLKKKISEQEILKGNPKILTKEMPDQVRETN